MPNYIYDKKRLEAFIDAIIAILLTILVLELRIPENEHTQDLSTAKQVLSLLPSFVSYIASFLLIVGIWIDHHILFLNLQKVNKRFILLNMLFILSLSVVPFSTAFAGNHANDSFAVAFLACNYFIMNFFFSTLYWYSGKNNMLVQGFFEDNKATALFSFIGMFCLLLSVPMAYVDTRISFALFIIIFSVHLLKKK